MGMLYFDTDSDTDQGGYRSSLLGRALEEIGGDEANNGTYDSAYGSTYSDDGGGYDSKAPIPLDYSVLAIGVLTLGLILLVEVCRHALDHAAHYKPFFKAVLQMLYSELATLGIVELAVFLLIKYWKNLDKERKEVFGDVHFAIFYTAIFNAFQSVLTAMVTRRASDRLWVRTEQLELDHYVEIREEYERVEQLVIDYTSSSIFGKWFRNITLVVLHPGLLGKYHNLRVQVRFHELRLHFLESNNLPLTLKVSDYLRRSEMAVLIHLVHVSAAAWLFLTGGLNLMYFLSGMIGYATANVDVVSTCMTGVFFANIVVSVFVSLALLLKMRKIFQTIIKTNVSQGSDYFEGMEKQMSLFWWGSPHLVISIIQFMNFGYALSLAIVIMYWPYLTGFVQRFWYLISVFICYSVFLYILGLVLPQYTLCTSLGYLTNKKELQETVAMHRLEEREREQRRRLIEKAVQQNQSFIVLAKLQEPIEATSTTHVTGSQETVASGLRSSFDATEVLPEKKSLLLADLVKVETSTLRSHLPESSRENLLVRELATKARRARRKKAVSEGVAAMRAMTPLDFQDTALALQQKIQKKETETRAASRRSSRRKSSSQPAIIKGWQDITAQEVKNATMKRSMDDSDAAQVKKEVRRKSNSASGVIQSWRGSASFGTARPGALDEISVASGLSLHETKEEDIIPQWKKDRAKRLEGRKGASRKSQSASAVIQSWRDFSVSDATQPEPNLSNLLDESFDSIDLRALSSDDRYDYLTTRDAATIQVEINDSTVDNHEFPSVQDEFHFETLRETMREYDFDGTLRADDEGNDLVVIDDPDSIHRETKDAADDVAEDDGITIETDNSIGNLSDVDVVHTVRGFVPSFTHLESYPLSTTLLAHLTPVRLIHNFTVYFKGSSYHLVSHVFGTMVIFFWIGFRVEAMIAKTGVFFEPDSAWGINLKFGFWAEACWLFCFVVADLSILMLLHWKDCKSMGDHALNVAAIVDILLSGMTMALLFVAESKRCCYDEPEQTNRSSYIYDELERQLEDYDFEYECTCPGWGGRTYTGLGVIEPFTSLIALRLFRFLFADFVMKHIDNSSMKEKIDDKSSTGTDKDHISDPHLRDGHGGGHSHSHGMREAGTALELWERAINEFPDIVDRYGQFSGELLQAMLGLQVDITSSDVSAVSQKGSADNQEDDQEQKVENCEKPDTWQSHIKLAGTRYMHLSAECQGLIVAGRLGKPVKVMHGFDSENHGDELPTVHEGSGEVDHEKASKIAIAEFEVDIHQMSVERKTETTFIAPFASLVRSMRRCDRKLLPVLTTWVSVDVVMTQFEIVYFEAADHKSNEDEHIQHHTDACRSALQATKGGKGLRLCDVALGRKVVGHLDLSDVTEVHVEQDEDVMSDFVTLEKAASLYGDKVDMASEYWSNSEISRADTNKYIRAVRWLTMHEERLKLTTESGTLFLRFYADLANAEAEMSNSRHDMATLKKEVSFQWAVSIVRIVGPEQLHRQKLPHFGEGNDEELRDYLETQHFHEKELDTVQKMKIDRFPDLLKPISMRHLKRSTSLQERETTEEPKLTRPSSKHSLRRVLSLGTSERAYPSAKSSIIVGQDIVEGAKMDGEEVGSAKLIPSGISPIATNRVNPTIDTLKPRTIEDESNMEETFKQGIEAENIGTFSISPSPQGPLRTSTSTAVENDEANYIV